jgi:hypothetical protein
MNHLNEEQLILHYYGEEGETLAVEQHLEECGDCRTVYVSLQQVLNVVDSLPIPERGPEYGSQVWRQIESRVPARRRFRWELSPWRIATAGAFAAMLVAAFVAGRFYPQLGQKAATGLAISKPGSKAGAADPQIRERILLVAVGDYLERSQMMLIELANANPKGPLDVTAAQERAEDLLTENRLYRQTASHTGDTAVSNVLDELDRVLLDIAHAPARWASADIEQFRQRLKAEGILFKIRVLGSNVRNQEGGRESFAPAPAPKI